MHTLFYFTGTGNCLSVTKKLVERFSFADDKCISCGICAKVCPAKI